MSVGRWVDTIGWGGGCVCLFYWWWANTLDYSVDQLHVSGGGVNSACHCITNPAAFESRTHTLTAWSPSFGQWWSVSDCVRSALWPSVRLGHLGRRIARTQLTWKVAGRRIYYKVLDPVAWKPPAGTDWLDSSTLRGQGRGRGDAWVYVTKWANPISYACAYTEPSAYTSFKLAVSCEWVIFVLSTVTYLPNVSKVHVTCQSLTAVRNCMKYVLHSSSRVFLCCNCFSFLSGYVYVSLLPALYVYLAASWPHKQILG